MAKDVFPYQLATTLRDRRRGRPRGTSYAVVDRPQHVRMWRLLHEAEVPTLTAAARAVVDDTFGQGTPESKIKRLVRTYPFSSSDPN